MISLRLGDDVERVRHEFRAWLDSNPPPQVESDSSLESFVTLGRAWQAKLAAGRWLGVRWPQEFGGRGLGFVEEAVIQEELMRVRSPQILGLFGLTMVGPVLIEYGSLAQKQRFLSKILNAEEIWCQGFSEPGAGSDLAAIRTRAQACDHPERGRGFVVSGSKIWTSFAHMADWCFLLARTSREEKKHEGLTYLLVNMREPGILVRPLRQITGDEEFNEVFLDEVFVPEENVVGAVGAGWKIAIATLMYERVILTLARHLQSENVLRTLLADYRRGALAQDIVRDLAKEIADFCAVRALAFEHLLAYQGGDKPGPEGSMDKLLWSETFQSLARLAMRSRGDLAVLCQGHPDTQRYLYSRGRTIAAGTSEIQRTIIAERLLGLPRLGLVPPG